jgi:hypothetical protein
MTQEAFIKVLDKKGYSYEMMGDSVVVNGGDSEGVVSLRALTSLPPGVEFENGGSVNLRALTSLPPGVEFRNGGRVDLNALTSLSPGVVFRNKGDVKLDSLTRDWFSKWKGNIKGIDSMRLLNSMISKGLFER